MNSKTQFPPFSEVYEQIKPQLEKLEDIRQEGLVKEKKYMWIAFFGAIAACLGGIGYVQDDVRYPALMIILMIIGILVVIIGFVLRSGPISDYKDLFKKRIIGGIVQAVNSHFVYEPTSFIEKSTFLRTQLFSESRVDIYRGEDLVKGRVGVTDFRFCELDVLDEGSGDDSDTTIFNGIFLEADFHKYFNGRTLVLPKSETLILPKFLSRFTGIGAERVKSEDVHFEEEFVVYSTNQVTARYILSMRMMRDLVQLQKRLDGSLYVSFYEDKMYVAINWYRSFFEAYWEESATDESLIKLYYDELILCLNLIDDLNLNTRIWSKRP